MDCNASTRLWILHGHVTSSLPSWPTRACHSINTQTGSKSTRLLAQLWSHTQVGTHSSNDEDYVEA